MKRLLLGLLLSGVALFSSATSHYPDRAWSTRSEVTVRVIFLPTHEVVDAVCAWLSGQRPEGSILGCYYSAVEPPLIFVVEPTSFNDHQHLLILGHEFWHALGAEHPAW